MSDTKKSIPSTSTVEEIARKLSNYDKWLNEEQGMSAREMMTPGEAIQAINRLIQQAELRGRIDELNKLPERRQPLGSLHYWLTQREKKERIDELQDHLKEADEQD